VNWIDEEESLTLDLENNRVEMKCSEDLKPYTVAGPIKNLTFLNPVKHRKKWKE
jgi:hypothetical protein